jgi:hypothetical protein
MSTLFRKFWQLGKVVSGLAIFYVLIYVLLSLCGHYETIGIGEARPEAGGIVTDYATYDSECDVTSLFRAT